MIKCKHCNNKVIEGFDVCFDCYLKVNKSLTEIINEERKLNKNVLDRY